MHTAETTPMTNGAAMAAFLSAGIGSFAMGLVVILNEAGLFPVPSLHAPAGGVSTRTTVAVVVWLVAWGILHAKWKERDVKASSVCAGTLALIAMGVVLAFPPVWSIL